MNKNHLEEWMEENGRLIDEIAKQSYVVGSPEYDFQQGVISAMRRYRESIILRIEGLK